MPIQETYHILHKEEEIKKISLTIMAPINDSQENDLDIEGFTTIKIGKQEIEIDKKDVLAYGDINFDDNGPDVDIIENLNFLDNCSAMKGEVIPANYDYETHTCKSKLKSYQITETWNPLYICKYAHGCLNKPKKIIIFTYDIKR